MDWSKLSSEILHNIFQRLDNKSISQCVQACRRWKDPAQRIFFEKVTNTSEENLKGLSNALSIYQDSSYGGIFGQTPANFVKTVNFQSFHAISECELRSLDELFPNLEYVIPNKHLDRVHEQLYKVIMEGKFPCLKQIPRAYSTEPESELVLLRKEFLELLKIDVISPNDDKIYQNLHLFKNLKALKLNFQSGSPFESLLSNIPPQLTSIKLKSDNYDDRISYMVPSMSLEEIHCAQPLPNVREVFIRYADFDHSNFYLYIMKKFPNLNTLDMGGSLLKLNNNDVDLTTHNIIQFVKYLLKMRGFSRSNLIKTNQFTTQIAAKVINNAIASFGNVSLSLDLTLSMASSELDQDSSMALVNDVSGNSKFFSLILDYRTMLDNVLQPHSDFFQTFGNMDIGVLNIYLKKITIPPSPIVLLELNTILDCLSKIQKLNITHAVIYHQVRKNLENSCKSTLELLSFHSCTLTENVFSWISAICPNVKTLEVKRCTFLNQIEDQSSRYFSMVMPSTCLQALRFLFDFSDDSFGYKKVFIKLTTRDKGPTYCKIITDDPDNEEIIFPEHSCTEAHYTMCLDDNECAVFSVYCAEVKELTVNGRTDSVRLSKTTT